MFCRIVRVGIIQNKIVLPTTDSILSQKNALYNRIESMITAAVMAKVNVICLQEAWSKFYSP